MTSVAAWEDDRLASSDVAAGKYPPHRGVRVEDARWEAFGFAVGGRKRSAWLSDFIDAVNHDPQAWREFSALAEARGEEFPVALVKALLLYHANG